MTTFFNLTDAMDAPIARLLAFGGHRRLAPVADFALNHPRSPLVENKSLAVLCD